MLHWKVCRAWKIFAMRLRALQKKVNYAREVVSQFQHVRNVTGAHGEGTEVEGRDSVFTKNVFMRKCRILDKIAGFH